MKQTTFCAGILVVTLPLVVIAIRHFPFDSQGRIAYHTHAMETAWKQDQLNPKAERHLTEYFDQQKRLLELGYLEQHENSGWIELTVESQLEFS